MTEQPDEIRSKIESFKMTINRIPKSTYETFKALADQDFCSDYGMTLKWCIDNAIKQEQLELIIAEMVDIKTRLEELEKSKKIKTMSGKEIGE